MLPHLTITYTSKSKRLKTYLCNIFDIFFYTEPKHEELVCKFFFHHQVGDIKNVRLLSGKNCVENKC
jgi:hypothetical protein